MGKFEIENIRWPLVWLVAAFSFIFGFTFFDKWVGLVLVIISLFVASFITGSMVIPVFSWGKENTESEKKDS